MNSINKNTPIEILINKIKSKILLFTIAFPSHSAGGYLSATVSFIITPMLFINSSISSPFCSMPVKFIFTNNKPIVKVTVNTVFIILLCSHLELIPVIIAPITVANAMGNNGTNKTPIKPYIQKYTSTFSI